MGPHSISFISERSESYSQEPSATTTVATLDESCNERKLQGLLWARRRLIIGVLEFSDPCICSPTIAPVLWVFVPLSHSSPISQPSARQQIPCPLHHHDFSRHLDRHRPASDISTFQSTTCTSHPPHHRDQLISDIPFAAYHRRLSNQLYRHRNHPSISHSCQSSRICNTLLLRSPDFHHPRMMCLIQPEHGMHGMIHSFRN